MNIVLYILILLAAFIIIVIISMGVGRFIKRSNGEISRIMEQERKRRFWERKE